jgi:hypothetical protein
MKLQPSMKTAMMQAVMNRQGVLARVAGVRLTGMLIQSSAEAFPNDYEKPISQLPGREWEPQRAHNSVQNRGGSEGASVHK